MTRSFTATLWLADFEAAAWVFATVPTDISDEIAESSTAGGFGSVRVEVTIGASTWRTSVFPDTKRGAYILPVKKAIRTTESIEIGDTVRITLTVLA